MQRTIESAINKARTRLINHARKKGLCENFGQKDVMKLEDQYLNSSSYSPDMNRLRSQIAGFDNWCSTYEGGIE